MKSWLQDNNIEMYLADNEGKSVVAERFIRTLTNKIYKYMTSISQNLDIDKLADIINEYNNIYHTTVQVNPVDVKSSTYIDFTVGMWIYRENVNGECTVPWTYVIEDLNGEEIIGKSYEKELQKKKEFWIEKVIKKGNKFYVKWKGILKNESIFS